MSGGSGQATRPEGAQGGVNGVSWNSQEAQAGFTTLNRLAQGDFQGAMHSAGQYVAFQQAGVSAPGGQQGAGQAWGNQAPAGNVARPAGQTSGGQTSQPAVNQQSSLGSAPQPTSQGQANSGVGSELREADFRSAIDAAYQYYRLGLQSQVINSLSGNFGGNFAAGFPGANAVGGHQGGISQPAGNAQAGSWYGLKGN